MKRFWIFPLLLTSLLAAPVARADLDVHFIGVVNQSKPEGTLVPDSPAGKLAVSYGPEFVLPFTREYLVKSGAIFLNRQNQGTGDYASRSSVFVPLIFQYAFSPQLRIGLGPYYDLKMGAADGSTRGESYGGIGSLDIDIPLLPGIGMLLQGRYARQFSDLAIADGASLKYTDLMVVTGFRLGFSR